MKVFEEKALAGLEELKLNTAALDLDTVSQQAAAESWSYTEFLGCLLDGELKRRHQVRVEMSLQFARFPYLKRLSEFDFKAQPAVDNVWWRNWRPEGSSVKAATSSSSARPASARRIWRSHSGWSRLNSDIGSTSRRRSIWRESSPVR